MAFGIKVAVERGSFYSVLQTFEFVDARLFPAELLLPSAS